MDKEVSMNIVLPVMNGNMIDFYSITLETGSFPFQQKAFDAEPHTFYHACVKDINISLNHLLVTPLKEITVRTIHRQHPNFGALVADFDNYVEEQEQPDYE